MPTVHGIHLSSPPGGSIVDDVEHRIVFLYQIALVCRSPPTIDFATTGFQSHGTLFGNTAVPRDFIATHEFF